MGLTREQLTRWEELSKEYDFEYEVGDSEVYINGGVNLCSKNLGELPFKGLGKYTLGGNLECGDNDLVNLKGCPSKVAESFFCSGNKLVSLGGCPSEVGGDFLCNSNRLGNLEGCPSEVGGDLWC